MTLETAKELLAKYHQEHVLQYYDTLSDTEKAALLEQIEETDFSVTEQITAGKGEQARGVITPIQAMTLSEISELYRNRTGSNPCRQGCRCSSGRRHGYTSWLRQSKGNV